MGATATEQASFTAEPSVPAQLEALAPPRSWRWPASWRWEAAVAGFALASGIAAVWITLGAGFLQYPGWLAVQKADLILGPVGVGLYWRHRRPESRFGALMVVLGLVGVPYILESSTVPALFAVGLMAESAIYLMTTVVILAFPSGRLNGHPERLVIALVVVAVVLPTLVLEVALPHVGPTFSISGCRAICPSNGLAIWSAPSWMSQVLLNFRGYMLVAIPLATAGVIVWRFRSGSPPRRRAMAIGGPIALLFVLMQATYRTMFLLAPNGLAPTAKPVQDTSQWLVAGARSFVWYGFLFALLAAELYAGRVLRRLMRDSLAHPSLRQLEQMLRGPLGDPSLRLGFWRPSTGSWSAGDGRPFEPPGTGQALTEIKRDGHPAAAMVHDVELAEDPELLRAAGAVALLAVENARLEMGWRNSLRRLDESRASLSKASDTERRKLERDLHDGAQQRLLAVLLRLSAAGEAGPDNPELNKQLDLAGQELEAAIHELRDLARGIYPSVLANHGLAGALRGIATRFPAEVHITRTADRRFSPEVETAFYYCCLEAIQNAAKHAGPDSQTTIRLRADSHELHLEVGDNGPGFDLASARNGMGLQTMRDRLGAVGGHTEILSTPGHGTLVKAAVALNGRADGMPPS